MYKKGYGRMTVRAWLNVELERSSPVLMLVFGFLLLIAALTVRFCVGAPYRMILETGIADMIPPVWLLALLWSLSFFLIGCAAGFVLGYRMDGCESEKYKGCMLFILLALLELCWYPTFFGVGLIFVSVLEALLILCLSIWIMGCFYRVSKFAGMLFLFHNIWLVYMLILNFAVLFKV